MTNRAFELSRRSIASAMIRAVAVLCLLASAPIAFGQGAEGPGGLEKIRAALQGRDYAAAVTAADDYVKAGGKLADEAAYLKATALFNAARFGECVEAADVVLKQHVKSPWFRKALFLKGSSLARQRRFDLAEAIYEEEAQRILSGGRKKEVAGVIVQFADELAKDVDPKDVGATPPNYAKAYNLYAKALTLEIEPLLREEVMFKRAATILKASNPGQAIADFNAYLTEFDPDWLGLAGSIPRAPRLPTEKLQTPIGRNRLMARYLLAEAQIDAGQLQPARQVLEDLLVLIASQKAADGDAAATALTALRGDALWSVVRSYGMPSAGGDDLDLALKAAADFLKEFPKHPHSVEAAFQSAQALWQSQRHDQAIAAYEAFIKGDIFKLPDGDSATKKLKRSNKSPAELKEDWTRTATYAIAEIRYAQKKYAEAIGQWQKYVAQFPNGSQWADSQRSIIAAEFQIALEAVAAKKYADARRLFDQFLAQHPLDERTGRVLFTLGQIAYAEADELNAKSAKEKVDPAALAAAWAKAIDEWSRLVSKYPNTEESSLALYRIGLIHEEQLGDLDKALDAYRRLNWGTYAASAQARVAVMTHKHLALSTERTFRSNEAAKVKINVRNVEKLTVKQYFLDLEAYFRKVHQTGGVENLDIALITPDKTWEYKVEGYSKYKPIEQQIEIPFELKEKKLTSGVCIINISEEDLEATTLVVRSDIDLIQKTSRREVLVYVQDMLGKKPAGGVDVLVSDGAKVIATGKTSDDGVFLQKVEGLKDCNNIRVFARRDGHVASSMLSMQGLTLTAGLSPKGYLYTDRHLYQPGHSVNVRGILRDVKDGQYILPPKENVYIVSVTDPSGRLLREEEAKLNDFGAFATAMQLDDAAPLGGYTITARLKSKPETAYSTTFNVQRYQLQKMKVALSFDRKVYFRGELVKGTATAEYYWGEPVIGRLVRYTLPDGRSHFGTTDKKGQVTFSFDTTPMPVGRVLNFTAAMEGENVAATDAVFLSRVGFLAEVKASREMTMAGEPFDVTVTTKLPDGKPVTAEMTLTVLRREVRKADPVLSKVPWLEWSEGDPDDGDVDLNAALMNTNADVAQVRNFIANNVAQQQKQMEQLRRAVSYAEVTVSEHKVKTDEKTGEGRIRLSLDKGGQYILRVAGKDRFDQPIVTQDGIFVSDDEDATKLRLLSDLDTLKVGQQTQLILHSRIDGALALVTFEGETILGRRIVTLRKGANPVLMTVEHAHYPNFAVAAAAMDERHLRTALKAFKVERQLTVVVKPVKGVVDPGSDAKVELTVTDQLGKAVKAELSLSLVDEALHAVAHDPTVSILDFFQAGAFRDASFHASSTVGFKYTGLTRKVIKELLEENERLARVESETRELKDMQKQVEQLQKLSELSLDRDGVQDLKMEQSQLGALQHQGGQQARYGNAPVNGRPVPTQATGSVVSLFGGPNAGEASTGRAARRVELPDAGYWIPSIVTGDDGKAVATIPMPANTTKWRLMSRGVTVETLVGEAKAEIITRKDFFVEIKTPPALREGDKPRVIARVHNLTDYAGPVKLTLTVTAGERKFASFTQDVKVEKQSSTEVVFDAFETPAVAKLQFEVSAEAGDKRDALARHTPVTPWGLEFADHTGGTATGDTTITLELPKGQKYTSQWLTLSLGPSLKQAVIDLALDGGTAGPRDYRMPTIGTFAGSELLAVVGGLEYAKIVQATPKTYETLAERARGLVATLVVSQHSSGGWTWQAPLDKGQPDWTVSAMTYWALVRANAAGIKVHPDTLNKAQTYLKNTVTQLQSFETDARAVVLHALSTSKAVDFTHLNDLHRERQRLTPVALAYTALAFANLDRKELAEEVLAVLETRVKAITRDERELAYWTGEGRYPWLNDEVETTAVALLALAKVKPQSPLTGKAAEYLLNRRGCFGFNPAKARGPAVAALASYHGKAVQAGDDYTLAIVVNGKEVKSITRKGDMATVLLDVPAVELKEGVNTVTFRKQGAGQYAYAATLRGFSATLKDPNSFSYPYVQARYYYHSQLEYRGKPIGVNSSSPVKNLETGQRTTVNVQIYDTSYNGYLVVEESFPAGTRLVDGSLSGGYQHVEYHDNRVVMYYPATSYVRSFSYELVGHAAGQYRALPTVIRDAMNPGRMRIGKESELTVLPPNQKSPDPYQMNDGERYQLGTLYFNDGMYKEALDYLPALFDRESRYAEREVARMLLWIHTDPSFHDAKRVVETFEVLRRRYPDLTIPFDKILVVGKAFRGIGEFERAMIVFQATIDSSFINDSNISAILQDEGQLFASIAYQENLWREYPDTADSLASYFALAQLLYEKAPQAHLIAKEMRRLKAWVLEAPVPAPGAVRPEARVLEAPVPAPGAVRPEARVLEAPVPAPGAVNGHDPKSAPTKIDMYKQSIDMLSTFVTLYPEHPLADDAAFSMCNVLLDLKAFDTVVKLSETFKKRYEKTEFVTSFQYMTALGHFWRRAYEPALAAAKVVADGESKDRDFARYILGQIYHAEGKPGDAIAWYKRVEQIYADAKQAISYFEEKRIGVDEVTNVQPGKPVELKIKYRNIKEANVQVYKVDLMKLYLREKNLSRITAVNLAGISPQLVLTEQLGDGKDYIEKEKTVKLDIKDEAAYLVICRGDDLFASGLVLITPLEIEVQEDATAGQIRANVIDKVTSIRPAEVHVKAIGSADTKFKSGETDLRGLFIGDGLRGNATIIARAGDNRYAFYRGKTWLGAPAAAPNAPPSQPGKPSQQLDYQQNLRGQQYELQRSNYESWDKSRRIQNRGVEIYKAK